MKKTILCLILGMVLFSAEAMALEPVYNIGLTIERHPIYLKPSGVNITSLGADAGTPSPQAAEPDKPSAYLFKFYNKAGELLAEYAYTLPFIVEDAREIVDAADFTVSIPYNQLAKHLEIYNQGNLILRYGLPEFCTENGNCDSPESYYTCPADCTTFASDGVCVAAQEGQCDSDCHNAKDLDCSCGDNACQEYESKTSCKTDCDPGSSSTRLLIFFAASMMAAVIGLAAYKRRIGKNLNQKGPI